MDDFDLERDLEDAGIDAFEFSLMDEDDRREALSDAGLDPDFYLDADLDSGFDTWSNLQSAGINLSDLDLMDEEERREALELAGGLPSQDEGFVWSSLPVAEPAAPQPEESTPEPEVTPQPETQEVQPVYRYCQVRFPNSSQTYAYRTDEPTIAAGDFVMVPVGSAAYPRLAQVISVGDYAESVVPYPLGMTKFILRKATAEEQTAETKDEEPAAPAQAPAPPQSQVDEPPETDELPELDEDELAVQREKTHLLVACAVLLGILAVMLSVMLYIVRHNDHVGQTEDVRAPSTAFATASPAPSATPRPTARPTSTPRPTARPTSTPRPTATPKRTTSSKKSTQTTDPYNAKSYSYADDFYDDYYDDFWDYEDAEDYWEEWN